MCDNITLMENMKSYHYLAVQWLQIMGDYIDQETTCSITFLLTFRQDIQQTIIAKTRPLCNDKDFDNLYNIDSYACQNAPT